MRTWQVITLSFVLSLFSPLTDLVAASVVTVDPSLSSLLNVHTLPPPHSELSVAVSRELVGAGYHRTLWTSVEHVSSHSSHTVAADSSGMQVALVENVTCDVYIDVDQVAFLAEFGGPDLIVSSVIDTEKPASLSSSHTVMTFTSARGNVELPLHFRYQPPSSLDSPYKVVTIPPPMLFVLTNQLPETLQQQHNSIELPCNASHTSHQPHLCSWTRVQARGMDLLNNDNLELSVKIPQGLEGHRMVVIGITIFITLMATLFLAYNFMNMKDRTEESGKKSQ